MIVWPLRIASDAGALVSARTTGAGVAMGVAGFVVAGLPTGRRPGDWAARLLANSKESEATNNVFKHFMKTTFFRKGDPKTDCIEWYLMWPLEHKHTHGRCLAKLEQRGGWCDPVAEARKLLQEGYRLPTRKSVAAEDTTSPRPDRSSHAEQTLVPAVQDERQTLVSEAEHACRAGYAAT